MPVLPRHSLREPTRYQSWMVMMGARLSLRRSTLRPFFNLCSTTWSKRLAVSWAAQLLRQAQADGQEESHQEESAGGRGGGLGRRRPSIWKAG